MTEKINKKDLSKLIDIAKSSRVTEIDLEEDDNFSKVQKFILCFKIKEGKNKIMASLIYKIYSDWATNSVGKPQFFHEFAKLFMPMHGKKVYYLLNYKPGGLVKKGVELIDKRDNVE